MNELIKEVYPELLKYCKSFGLQISDCKDIIQNVLIKTHQKIKPDFTAKQLFNYLKINIRWEYINFMKEREKENEILNYTGETLDFSTIQYGKNISPHLFQTLLKFASPLNCETLELFYLQKLTIKELSDKLNISAGSVTSRLTRGRKEIVQALIAVRELFNDKR